MVSSRSPAAAWTDLSELPMSTLESVPAFMISTPVMMLSKRVESETEQYITKIITIAHDIGNPQQQVLINGSSFVASGGAAPRGKQQNPHS